MREEREIRYFTLLLLASKLILWQQLLASLTMSLLQVACSPWLQLSPGPGYYHIPYSLDH